MTNNARSIGLTSRMGPGIYHALKDNNTDAGEHTVAKSSFNLFHSGSTASSVNHKEIVPRSPTFTGGLIRPNS